MPTEEELQSFEEEKKKASPEEPQEMLEDPPCEQVGLGLVGSVTFALMGETTADLSPEHAYALHCCWELQFKEDPRAPEERSIEEGLKMLREYNRI